MEYLFVLTLLLFGASAAGYSALTSSARLHGFRTAWFWPLPFALLGGWLSNNWLLATENDLGWEPWGGEHIFFLVVGGCLAGLIVSCLTLISAATYRWLQQSRSWRIQGERIAKEARTPTDVLVEGLACEKDRLDLIRRLQRLRDHGFKEDAEPGLDEPATLFIALRLAELRSRLAEGKTQVAQAKTILHFYEYLIEDMEIRNGLRK